LAATLILAAAVVDLTGRATERYPFAADPIVAGAALTVADIEWRDIPRGLLPTPPDIADGTGPADSAGLAAAHDIAPGEPITPSHVTTGEVIPDGWWSVPVDLPEGVATGTAVRLVATEPQVDGAGVVARPTASGPFAVTSPGLVAVPPELAGAVARASAGGTLLVLIGT
jgi:hypothetical protein